MDFRKVYDESLKVSKEFSGEILTVQSSKDECDINNILRKYNISGVLGHVQKCQGVYEDFSDAKSFKESMDLVIKGEEAFMSLPSSVRKKFANSPIEFLDFVGNPANKEELEKLGLARKIGVQNEGSSEAKSSVSDSEKSS